MAQVTTITLTDDMTGDLADETVNFGLDGSEYVIDLSSNNAGILRDIMSDYVTRARKVGKLTAASNSRAGSNGTSSGRGRDQMRAIRDWARQNGHNVSDRGRVPTAVLEQFDAVH